MTLQRFHLMNQLVWVNEVYYTEIYLQLVGYLEDSVITNVVIAGPMLEVIVKIIDQQNSV